VTESGVYHAFFYDGIMHDLGTLDGSGTQAMGINTGGQIVGKAYRPGYQTAFLYDNDTIVDLNSEIAPSSGWTLREAYAINDNGWIVGDGINASGQPHAFLLTPIPEPSTLALLGIGAIGLLGYAWRKKRHAV
jgi:probable HAF family extracellular repeat protein